jgi:hypothetical protein
MSGDLQRGKVIVIAIISAALGVSLVVGTVEGVVRGPQALVDNVFRFLLTVLLLKWLYIGNRFAKWLVVVLFGGAGVLSLVFLGSSEGLWSKLPFLLIGVTYLGAALTLIVSPNVATFLTAQRESRRQDVVDGEAEPAEP